MTVVHETEITERVALSLPNGKVNPAAVGWSRTPLHDTALKGWGRNKRFEYWCLITPEIVAVVNISHHDYRANIAAMIIDLGTGEKVAIRQNKWLPGRNNVPETLHEASAEGRAEGIVVRIEPNAQGVHLFAEGTGLEIDLQVDIAPGRESMAVVVPWSARRYQYTKKDNCLPATGTVVMNGAVRRIAPEDGYVIHDHGRGRWPYHTLWNWGAGSGTTDGHEIGLQFGGKWTVGTPSTENAVRIDGCIHKISEELAWDYDPTNFMAPWRITGERVDLTFQPVHYHHHMFDRRVITSRGDQCFGTYSGHVVGDDGERYAVRDVYGLIEEVERRW